MTESSARPAATPPASAPRSAGSTPRTPTDPGLTAWRNALFVVFGLCGLGFASWASRVPAVSASLDLDSAQTGILLFGIAAGSLVGLPIAGHLVARFGSRSVILVTLIIGPIGLAIAGFGTATVNQFAVAFAGLVLYGAANGACDVAMNVSGAANERRIGRTIMPIYHAFFSFGTMLGAGIGAITTAAGIPLDLHLGGIAIVIAITIVIVVRYLQVEDSHSGDEHAGQVTDAAASVDGSAPAASGQTGSFKERMAIWLSPATLLIGVIVLGMAFAEGSANDWLAYAMVNGHFTSEETGAIVFGIFVTAMTVGRLGGVRLLDRYGRVPVLRVSAVFAAVGLLMLIFVPVVWVAIVGVVLWGLGASLGFPVGMSAAADDPRTAAVRVSAVATIGYLAFLVGPPVIGFLGHEFGILNGMLVVLILVAAAGALSQAAREPEKK